VSYKGQRHRFFGPAFIYPFEKGPGGVLRRGAMLFDPTYLKIGFQASKNDPKNDLK
jgi:hypothetical protein